MPAVLVEMAFIDCSTTSRSLTEPRTRYRMVEALADGVEQYFRYREPTI
jgi:N-acetylmuramoyl-L-alanine amidase